MIVMVYFFNVLMIEIGFFCVAKDTNTKVAPFINGINISSIDISKQKVVNPNTMSALVISK